MKKVLSLLSIFSLFLLISCTQTVESTNASEETDNTEKVSYAANDEINVKIDGMMCAMGCKGAIEKELNNTAGIAECNVDFENGTAHIAFDNGIISQDEIINTIGNVNDGAYQATLKESDSELTEVENSNS